MLPRLNIIVFLLCSVKDIVSKMEPFIVNGRETTIEKYPHSGFLAITCGAYKTASWICGCSILNQLFVLTAAHCVIDCSNRGRVWVAVGNENRLKGFKTQGNKYMVHNNYNDATLECDIALVRVKTALPLGKTVKRIVLMRTPPEAEFAYIAGWGMLSDEEYRPTKMLMHTIQKIWSLSDCINLLGEMNPGVICAGKTNQGYAAPGDSGSALVIEDYIQIGIVSYKVPQITKSLIVYTNVSYFYDWIVNSTRKIYCG